ncbi:uncharacterized protein ACNLHF_009588 isoform 2-T2 [Anomaloglossus baeobatrachus]
MRPRCCHGGRDTAGWSLCLACGIWPRQSTHRKGKTAGSLSAGSFTPSGMRPMPGFRCKLQDVRKRWRSVKDRFNKCLSNRSKPKWRFSFENASHISGGVAISVQRQFYVRQKEISLVQRSMQWRVQFTTKIC